MKLFKEKYISIFYDYEISIKQIYYVLLRLKLINNLKCINNNLNKIFYSFNKKIIIKIIIYKEKNILLINVNTYTNDINIIRNIIKKEIHNIQILYSDFMINKNIDFYQKFIKYENNIRQLIIKKLSIKYGEDWWFTNINKKISNICIKRANHDKNKFHYIFYADFMDLGKIILSNWDDFRDIFYNNKDKLIKFNKLNNKRNKIFHGRFDFI